MTNGPSGPEDDERATTGSDDAPTGSSGPAVPWGGWTGPPTEEVYTQMWRAFRDGMRSKKALRVSMGLSKRMVYTAVERGWPERQWPSLRSRLELWERQQEKSRAAELDRADRAAAAATGKSAAEAWREFAPKAMAVAADGLEALGVLGRKIKQAAEVATFTRYRRVRKTVPGPLVDGQPTTRMVVVDELYVDAAAVVKAVALFNSGTKEIASAMAFLVGSGRTESGDAPELSPEQVEQIARGEMPEGLTMEQVARAVIAGRLQALGGNEGA